MYGAASSDAGSSAKIAVFGSIPARSRKELFTIAGIPSPHAEVVCAASVGAISTLDLPLSMSTGVGVRFFSPFKVTRPAAASTLSARPWLDGSFGMATVCPSIPSSESWSFQNSASGTISVEPIGASCSSLPTLYSAKKRSVWKLLTSFCPWASATFGVE